MTKDVEAPSRSELNEELNGHLALCGLAQQIYIQHALSLSPMQAWHFAENFINDEKRRREDIQRKHGELK